MIEYCNCGRPTRSHDKGAECDKPRVRMVDGVPVEVRPIPDETLDRNKPGSSDNGSVTKET